MQTKEARAASKRRYYLANREKALAGIKAWRAAHPERVREIHRKNAGLPEPTRPAPEFCECCLKKCSTGRHLALDHDHASGAFRGWLCATCNTAIGKLGDDVEGLRHAIAYLQRSHH